MWNQFVSITMLNLRNLRFRLGSSQMIVIGVGGVTGVLVALAMLSEGLSNTLDGAASEDRVVIVRAGATSEINGSISPEQYQIVRNLAGIRQAGSIPLAAAESYVSINLEDTSGQVRSTPLRGISNVSMLVRDEVTLIDGRLPGAGQAELIVGQALQKDFAELV